MLKRKPLRKGMVILEDTLNSYRINIQTNYVNYNSR